uniref:ARAD1D17710p n=1 Tax=Blastobotrys adeninivorans TaxID=409370 RepID=A0A060TEX3_BLAAD
MSEEIKEVNQVNQVNEIKERPRSEPTPPAPEGMTKSAWKRELKRRRWEEQREEYTEMRKQKRKKLKQERKKNKQEQGIEGEKRPPKIPVDKKKSPMSVIVDCAFDDLMKEGERTSLASQIVRCYSDNRRLPVGVNLRVTSFNKLLKERFDVSMRGQHSGWKDITLEEDDYEVPENEKGSYVYLSSDSDNVIETLDESKTYIIGGIVDKGRYKNLCKDKAEKQGIATGRLPIDQFIKLSGRRVLTTNHVFEILLRWLEVKDWKQAFETVLPPRKLIELAKGTDNEPPREELSNEEQTESANNQSAESEHEPESKPEQTS